MIGIGHLVQLAERTRPRGVAGPVLQMARPRRPVAERDAVRAAATGRGTAAQRALHLARAVAKRTLAEIDRDPEEHIFRLLRDLEPSPLDVLATSPEIDTAALFVAERVRRLRDRAGRRLSDGELDIEDTEIIAAVTRKLTDRYRKHL